jgi:hypothetical protein
MRRIAVVILVQFLALGAFGERRRQSYWTLSGDSITTMPGTQTLLEPGFVSRMQAGGIASLQYLFTWDFCTILWGVVSD